MKQSQYQQSGRERELKRNSSLPFLSPSLPPSLTLRTHIPLSTHSNRYKRNPGGEFSNVGRGERGKKGRIDLLPLLLLTHVVRREREKNLLPSHLLIMQLKHTQSTMLRREQ